MLVSVRPHREVPPVEEPHTLVVDAASLAIIKTIPVGKRPWGVTLSPDGNFLYAANGTSNDVSVVDTRTFQEVAKLDTGGKPWGALAVPDVKASP